MSWILRFSLTLTFLPGVESKEYPCEWKKRIISGPLHSNHDFCPSCPQPRILSYTVLTVFWSELHSSYIFIIFCLSCISYSGGCVWIMHLCAWYKHTIGCKGLLRPQKDSILLSLTSSVPWVNDSVRNRCEIAEPLSCGLLAQEIFPLIPLCGIKRSVLQSWILSLLITYLLTVKDTNSFLC